MIIKKVTSFADLPLVTLYISELNQSSRSHIGYLGTQLVEIDEYLKEIVEDSDSFLLAATSTSGHVLGVLGLDVDRDRQFAEVLGPFSAQDSKWNDIVSSLWEEAISSLEDFYRFQLFFHEDNTDLLEFAKENGFVYRGKEVIYQINESPYSGQGLTHLRDEDETAFERLHDSIFPQTYYNGSEILDRVNEERPLFVYYNENQEPAGYLYMEANPLTGEGSVEFLGVHSEFRKQGIGRKLLQMGLEWFFHHKHYHGPVTLCVQEDLKGARNLYEAVGFEKEEVLLTYLKN